MCNFVYRYPKNYNEEIPLDRKDGQYDQNLSN